MGIAQSLLCVLGARPNTGRPLEVAPERCHIQGPEILSDAELLSLTLDVPLESAQRLLARFGLPGLARATLYELQAHGGLDRTQALKAQAVMELARRLWAGVKALSGRKIRKPEDAALCVLADLSFLDHERLLALLLDADLALVHKVTVAQGGLFRAGVTPADVLRPVLRHGAVAFVLALNHPSGVLTPSSDDVDFTVQMRMAADAVGVRFLDHIIVGRGDWMSLARSGLCGLGDKYVQEADDG